MQAIRKMEQAWNQVTQGNFSLSTYQDATGRTLPCYALTKTECLYIATKFSDDARIGTRGPRNLLQLLPDVFTIDDAKRVRQQEGKDSSRAVKMIRNWKSRGYVTQISDISFQKNHK